MTEATIPAEFDSEDRRHIATTHSLSPTVTGNPFFWQVLDELQNLDEMGAVDSPAEYVEILRAVAEIASYRADAAESP